MALDAPDPTEIAGVESRPLPAKTGRSVTDILFLTSEFTLTSAAQLVNLVDDERLLLFFDAEHPQRSDPGLYCYLQRYQGELYAMGANHGWSYPRLVISEQDAARWLWLCTDYNNGADRYESSVLTVRSAKPLGESDRAPRSPMSDNFKQWLAARLDHPTPGQ